MRSHYKGDWTLFCLCWYLFPCSRNSSQNRCRSRLQKRLPRFSVDIKDSRMRVGSPRRPWIRAGWNSRTWRGISWNASLRLPRSRNSLEEAELVAGEGNGRKERERENVLGDNVDVDVGVEYGSRVNRRQAQQYRPCFEHVYYFLLDNCRGISGWLAVRLEYG